jgi:uncharacterized protein YecE (DUF72 family)
MEVGYSDMCRASSVRVPRVRVKSTLLSDLAEIRLGTSSFTAPGWDGPFYSKGTKPADRLAIYAEHFDAVEIDSTFYATPSVQTVEGWTAKVPADFLFSVKVPQTITHDRVLVGCDAEFRQFVDTMALLGPKLGPMVSAISIL